ncbi:MAG: glycosyltransferase family 2 protein [Candidatus Sumerlaeota bacterium]|nr:glycosyltransferase family 2 protein [Candidatus Sumerlaeota bacterium]
MYKNHIIGVVVPAYNEEKLIAQTINAMPDFVDKIIIVDDASSDRTSPIVQDIAITNNKVILISHEKNRGVGSAISTGYIWCRDNNVDIAVCMDGDGQMDPADMPSLLDPVVNNQTDFAKGNRLFTGEAWKKIPRIRYSGNAALSFMTKIASGYWHVTDSQTGYTALNKKGLHLLPIENIYPRYGRPNDFLVTLNIYNMRVKDVPVKPVYGIGEKSGIRLSRDIFRIFFLIIRLFFRRMFQKYIIRDFHPLILFYTFGAFLLLLDIPLVIRLVYHRIIDGRIPPITALTVVFVTIMGFQSILFAMLFDMEANKDLRGDISYLEQKH